MTTPRSAFGFKPSVVAWSVAVSLAFLLGGAWLAAGELWFGDPADHDWENGIFWLVFAFTGLYFVGTWLATAFGRLLRGDVLAVSAGGINHFAVGRIAWSDLEEVRIRQRWGSGPHALLAIFKLLSAQPNLQLELVLKSKAYGEVAARLNTLDRLALMMAVSFYNARREVDLHCWAFDFEPPELAQALADGGAAHGVEVQDLTAERQASPAGSVRP
ncbi:MAG: hypothetical protein ABIR26_17470 [Ramlibacter sp.]